MPGRYKTYIILIIAVSIIGLRLIYEVMQLTGLPLYPRLFAEHHNGYADRIGDWWNTTDRGQIYKTGQLLQTVDEGKTQKNSKYLQIADGGCVATNEQLLNDVDADRINKTGQSINTADKGLIILERAPEGSKIRDEEQPLRDEVTDSSKYFNESGKVYQNHSSDKVIKRILFWNSWYHWRDHRFGVGVSPFRTKCHVDNCETTTNKSLFNQSDAVIFFGRLLDYSSSDVIPKRANSNQVYVYTNSESPYKTWGKTSLLGKEINVTMTYRFDSTIPWLTNVVAERDTSTHPYSPLSDADVRKRNGTVSWMISHCRKPGSTRVEYARELGRYTPIDIYGACGPFKCSKRNTSECMKNMETKYLFYLAFENSICTDYITEKVYRTLMYDLVPVIMGGANYTKHLPPNSFIDVRNFTSARHLAKYLNTLQRNPSQYLSYLQWKTKYVMKVIPLSEHTCQLCDLLHRNQELLGDEFDVGQWWEGKNCVTSKQDLHKLFPL